MVTVISKPIGHKLTDADLDATVSDSSGEALFTTAFAHGLVDGDYVYIQSNIESYNGFKYVDQTAYNTFKIRDSENSQAVAYKQVADALYKISVLQHGWQCVHLPIVYELESSLSPTNTEGEAYTPTTVVSQADENGYTLLNLSVGLEEYSVYSWIEIQGMGVYQIIESIQPWQIVINLAYNSTNVFGPVLRYYNNYCINVNIYAGIPVAHPWWEEEPIELAATLQLIPDANNRVKFSIAEILRGYIETRNNLTLDTLPNNTDFWTSFHIGYFESYDSSDGEEVTTTETEETVDTFVGYAVNAKLPFKTESIGHLSDYINEDTYLAQWMTIQTQPLAIVGKFFDLSFLLMTGGDLDIYQNGIVIQTITNPGEGVIRVPLEFDTAGEYCIQVYRQASGAFTPAVMDALDTWTNVDTGGETWVLNAGVPEIDFNGLGIGVFSDDWHTDYAFEAGQSYSFSYSIKGSNTASIFYIKIVDVSNVELISKTIPTIPESIVGTYTFTAPVGSAGISIWIDNPASCGGECLARIITFVNETEADPGASAGFITEDICITVLEECDSTFIEDDNIRLTEDGDFRILE